jgi:hypothetical protein
VISFTATPARITGSFLSNLWAARDVSKYKYIDLEVGVSSWESPTSPSLLIQLVTGFQLETYVGWKTITSFTISGTTNPYHRVTVTLPLYRYMTFSAGSLSGASAATLWVRGLARMKEG